MVTTEAWQWYNSADPADLVLKAKELPDPAADQVLVANQAIGLNPVDWKLMNGLMDQWKPGQIPGVDGMGTVVATGAAVRHVRPGARVAYHTNLLFDGSYSRHTLVAAKALIPVPDSVSDVAAAAMPCPGLTAWQALCKVPDPAGENVLVSGAGGAVGGFLTQLLVGAGARVYVTASPYRHASLLERGAIAAFDYTDREWQQQLRSTLASQSLYAAFDTVGHDSALSLAGLLGYYGHLVSVQDRLDQAPLAPFTTSISLHEIALAAIHHHGSATQWHRLVAAGESLLQQIGRSELRLPVLNVADFATLPEALSRLKQKNDGTKHVVQM